MTKCNARGPNSIVCKYFAPRNWRKIFVFKFCTQNGQRTRIFLQALIFECSIFLYKKYLDVGKFSLNYCTTFSAMLTNSHHKVGFPKWWSHLYAVTPVFLNNKVVDDLGVGRLYRHSQAARIAATVPHDEASRWLMVQNVHHYIPKTRKKSQINMASISAKHYNTVFYNCHTNTSVYVDLLYCRLGSFCCETFSSITFNDKN